MLLAVDIGNTNTVFALYEQKALIQNWRMQTVRARSPDKYAAFLGNMCELEGLAFKKISDVIISSVVPETHFSVGRFCKKYLNIDPVFITKNNVPIDIDLKRPEDVGADRLVNALAVITHYKAPAIVIDFGTATTFDVIDAKGRYAGGAIAPGINLSLDALHHAASKLPKIDVIKPQNVIGKSTTEAMHSGIFWGYTGLIEGITARIKKEMGASDLTVLATGGLAPLFASECKFIDTVDELLTLKGLLIIHQKMKE